MSEVFPKITRMNADEFGGGFNVDSEEGISLRDYFAAKAMQSFVRNWQEVYFDGDGEWEQKLSTRAYKLADAMLAEQDK